MENTHQQKTQSSVIASAYGLTKSFAGNKALDNIDFEVKAGQVFAVLGANGAGKTTLINILLGRINADLGEVRVFGSRAGSLQAKRQAGAMLQVANLPETLKIKEHIQLFQSYYPHPMDYQQVIEYAGLQKMQNHYSKKLSGGEKQRLLFALSICGNPKLLFLDEPSVGMDVEARQGLWQAIRDLRAAGTGIVLTTHYLEEADNLADEIALIKQGKIIRRGSSGQIKASISHTSIRFISNEKPEVFEPLPRVVSVHPSGKFIQLHTEDANQTLLALLSVYPNLQDLTVSKAGLEEAFLQLNSSGEKI
ncbi:ABC transporter ATP-binding protein [uncultured Paraglaciecola sp.]|uniref:ABC transporter ATP-binding protein n=1 Tax=uncultured Paraglaciecola sp. TaxID=1765024 RepID=UPI0030DD775D